MTNDLFRGPGLPHNEQHWPREWTAEPPTTDPLGRDFLVRCACGQRLRAHLSLDPAEHPLQTAELMERHLREVEGGNLNLAWMRDLGWFEPDPPMPDRALTELERLHVVWELVDEALGLARERLQQPPRTATEARVRADNGL